MSTISEYHGKENHLSFHDTDLHCSFSNETGSKPEVACLQGDFSQNSHLFTIKKRKYHNTMEIFLVASTFHSNYSYTCKVTQEMRVSVPDWLSKVSPAQLENTHDTQIPNFTDMWYVVFMCTLNSASGLSRVIQCNNMSKRNSVSKSRKPLYLRPLLNCVFAW